MKETGQSFAVALAATRAGNLFTTHTAAAAGFDVFPPALMEQYLGRYAQEQLGLSLRELLALGRKNPDDADEFFNMAYLATRGSGSVNGVSRLHGRVSRHILAPLYPRWPALHFGKVTVKTSGDQHVIAAKILLGDVSPDAVRVEVYANGARGGDAVRQEMTRVQPLAEEAGGYAYRATVSSARPATDYTARIMPRCDSLAVPLEADWILWQK